MNKFFPLPCILAVLLLTLPLLPVQEVSAATAQKVVAPKAGSEAAAAPKAKSGTGSRATESKKTPRAQRAGDTVYDGEPPVTARELDKFMATLPRFRSWAKEHDEGAHPLVNNDKADFFYSPVAAKWVQDQGWNPKRFFCVMGRMAAAMVIVEEGNDMSGSRPKDMPSVTQDELDLARKNLGVLLRAGGDAPPINANKYPAPQQFAAPRYVKHAKP